MLSQATFQKPGCRSPVDDTAPPIPLKFVIPGLLWLAGLELLARHESIQGAGWYPGLLTLSMLLIPWAAVWISSSGVDALGYRRDRALLSFGWGMVAGGIWRIVSVLLNLWSLRLNGLADGIFTLLAVLIWVPFLEETFFRGYLARSLSKSVGSIVGISLQAALFALLPSHTVQGLWHLAGIFGFGILAGWLTTRHDAIWPAWGAHAFANLLPLISLAAPV